MNYNEMMFVGEKTPKLEVRVARRRKGLLAEQPLLSPDNIVAHLDSLEDFSTLAEERLYVLAFDTKMRLIGYTELSKGTINGAVAMPRDMFKFVLTVNSTAFIVVHNHPSGDCTPSSEDDMMTKRVRRGADVLGLKLLDHIIVSSIRGEYYSYKRDSGIL